VSPPLRGRSSGAVERVERPPLAPILHGVIVTPAEVSDKEGAWLSPPARADRRSRPPHLPEDVMVPVSTTRIAVMRIFCLGIAAIGFFCVASTQAADVPAEEAKPAAKVPADSSADKVDTEKLFNAIVKVKTVAVPNARSTTTLGREREGSGVVIGDNGLVLTIGYLIVEADDVKITDAQGRTLPAVVVGYDHATGLGLVKSVVPMEAAPVPLGDSARTSERDPVLIASSGQESAAFAWIVSKRMFSGNWEYQLDSALYTSPPMMNWSGAALIDRDGKLLGIGSLIVREATDGDPKLPGNMFVPIDLLKPILADMIKNGHRAGPARPWLGVAADEVQGRLFVTRVSPEGPADRAGMKAGDIILAVANDSVSTQAEFYKKVWSRGHAGDDIPLKVLQGADIRNIKVRSIDRTEYFRPRTTY
jgi:serine protease Do